MKHLLANVTSTFLAVLSILIGQQSVSALPGQTLEQFDQAIRNSDLFRGMGVSDADFWAGSYSISKPYAGGDATLYFYPENNILSSETLQLRYPDISFSLERNEQSTLSLIGSVWGESIAQDFANSVYTDVIESPNMLAPSHFYSGEAYGYQTNIVNLPSSGGIIYTFSLMSHDEWEEAKRMARFCIANPYHDDCSGV